MKSRSTLLLFLCLFLAAAHAQIPSGYYNTATGKTGATLQVALYNIIKNHAAVTYTPGVWNAYYTTDVKANGKVWDMYSDVPGGTPPYEYTIGTSQCGTSYGEGSCYSREHAFPQSYFASAAPMVTDLHHLFPVDQYVNGTGHSNHPFGEVTTPTYTSLNGSKRGPCTSPGYTGTVFEPIDAYKGDFARAYFYMATRYQNLIASWQTNSTEGNVILNGTSFPAYETWFLNLLLSWDAADPVSQKEIDRNNAVYAIQANRNPFIDHPEYVAAVWVPNAGVLPEPTNYPTSFSSHNIQLQWTDATGTVVPDGYLVRMSTTSFAAIQSPVDGTSYPITAADHDVPFGVQYSWYKNLDINTTYFFKVFGYTGTGSSIDYKTDGSVPQVQLTTGQ